MYKRIIVIAIAAVIMLPLVAAAQTEKEAAAPSTALSVEAKLCTGIQDRQPVGEAESFPADVGQVYLWCRITGASGETNIHHVWLHEGKETANVTLTVKGSSWRTFSSKTIPPAWTGNWEVRVVGTDGNVLKSLTFTVGGEKKTGE